jgi:ABC-type phosphate transport system substrate-binding protein
MSRKSFVRILGFIAFSATVSQAASASSSDIAIVVNKTSTVVAISSNDLKAIYLGDRESWPNGQKVLAIALASGRPELKAFLKHVCGMSEGDYKKYFIQANFTGKTLVLPRMAASSAAVKAIVGATPGSIGFVQASDLDSSIGVVKLDGLSPGDPGYKLSVTP